MIHTRLSVAFVCVALLLIFTGCPPKEQKGTPDQQTDHPSTTQNGHNHDSCRVMITVEEVIVIKETDPAPVKDSWNLSVRLNGVPFQIFNGVGGDQGDRLVTDNPGFPGVLGPQQRGPVVLGLKNNRYSYHLTFEAEENDPPGVVPNDRSTNGDIEILDKPCPGDDIHQKIKVDVIDPSNGNERGQLEIRFKIVMDP
jgi:hypothetical protein